MKLYMNRQRLIALLLSGIVVATVSGCQAAPKTNETTTSTPVVSASPTDPVSETMTPEEKDNIAIDAFERMADKVEEYTTSEEYQNMKKDAKELFTTGVDFLFYGTEINGVTFEELTTSAKLKLLNLWLKVDSNIEAREPGYKESMGDHYAYFKALILEKGTQLSDKISDVIGEDNWQEIKDTCSDVKDIAGGIWDTVKEGAGSGKEKVKEWYENFRE